MADPIKVSQTCRKAADGDLALQRLNKEIRRTHSSPELASVHLITYTATSSCLMLFPSHVSVSTRLMCLRIRLTGHLSSSIQNKHQELGLGRSVTMNLSHLFSPSNMHHLKVFSEPFETRPMPITHIGGQTVSRVYDSLRPILWVDISLSSSHSNTLCYGCTVIGAVLFRLRYRCRQRMPDKRDHFTA